jgi:hypothetical protein
MIIEAKSDKPNREALFAQLWEEGFIVYRKGTPKQELLLDWDEIAALRDLLDKAQLHDPNPRDSR